MKVDKKYLCLYWLGFPSVKDIFEQIKLYATLRCAASIETAHFFCKSRSIFFNFQTGFAIILFMPFFKINIEAISRIELIDNSSKTSSE
jgi:hypothetical protein